MGKLTKKQKRILKEYNTPYFNIDEVDYPDENYVCWLDIMGTRSHMKESHRKTGIFFGKLHSELVEKQDNENIILYPIMDGAYIVTDSQSALHGYLSTVISNLAATNLDHDKNDVPNFAIRASIAYGPIIHGKNIPSDSNWVLSENAQYRDSLLIGLPMIQAIESESEAPPFGVHIHESARSFSPEDDTEPMYEKWWEWYDNGDEEVATEVFKSLVDHLHSSYMREHEIEGYTKEKIGKHVEMMSQYFLDLSNGKYPDGSNIGEGYKSKVEKISGMDF